MRTSNQDKYKCHGENSDAALVTRIQHGDKQAFGAVVSRYYAALLSIGRSYSRTRDDADDAVQNALLLAYLHLHQFERPGKTWPVASPTNNECCFEAEPPTNNRFA